ncbi:hypothetical protein L2E82_25625 [Cichorium intybus]|uniref:Uncharacterized protein n=1 Tax=Cichorium intybus TaxID=13427 RepID=A0ACB9E4K6_CICIN|nr:hypothetical protein L2E82_25625 [Cichorium intybus]
MNEELSGWKLVVGDVFREPTNSKLLCVMIGTGFQITGMAFVIIIFVALGFMSPASRGMLLTGMIILYIFLGTGAGYSGVYLWRSLSGPVSAILYLEAIAMSNLEDESAMCVPGDSFVGCDKSSEDLVNQTIGTHNRDVMEKAVEVIDIEKLAKDLENSSPLAIMDEALEKYGNDIAIAFRKDIDLLQMETKKSPVGAEHYELYEEIGQRVSASVFRAMCIPNKEIVAVEVLDFERSNIDLVNLLSLIAAGFTYCCSGVYLSLMNIDMTGLFETMTLETGFEGFAGMDNGSKKRPVSTD